MRISVIVAVARNGAIGFRNRLPWRCSADLRRFRSLTMGHHLVVGRKTWESIGRPLPGRTLLVVTRRPLEAPEGVRGATSLGEALRLAAGDPEVFVAGGADLYRQALPLAGRLYLTRIDAEVEGDAFFPGFDPSDWVLVERTGGQVVEEPPATAEFLVYDRRTPPAPPPGGPE